MWRLRSWEIALLCSLCVTLAAGLWAEDTQRELSEGLVRLHILANSDSPEDQAQKLQLRDRVLELLAPALEDCASRDDAIAAIEAKRREIEAMGVKMELGREYYPTRRYSSFSLPAGEYVSLRLTVGEGGGRNWWCVVFPPLCTEVLSEEASSSALMSLDDRSAALISGGLREYDLRFRVVEWWGEFKQMLESA